MDGGEINGGDWRNRTWVTMLALSLSLHAAAGLLVPALTGNGPKAPAPEKVVYVDLEATVPAPARLSDDAGKTSGPEYVGSEPEVVPLEVPPPPSGYIGTIPIAPAPPAPPPPPPARAVAAAPVAAPPPVAPPKPVPRPITVTQGVPEGPVRAAFPTSDSQGGGPGAGQGVPVGGPDSVAADGAARGVADSGAREGIRFAGETAGPPGRVWRESEVDQIPKPTYRPDPPISRRAKRLGVDEGEARALLTVSPDGKVVTAALVSENPAGITDEAFLATLRSWLFTPGKKAGKPVTVEMMQTVRFVEASQ